MNCSGRCLPSDLPVNRGRQRPDRQPRWCRSTGNCGSGIPGRAGTWTGSPSEELLTVELALLEYHELILPPAEYPVIGS